MVKKLWEARPAIKIDSNLYKYEKFISKKLLLVLSRIIGILLAALSVQFILDGLQEAIKTF